MEKKRSVNRRMLALILLGALVLLIGVYLLITLLPREAPPQNTGLRYEAIEGEDPSSNRIYPPVQYEGKQKNATYLDIKIEGKEGTFGIFKSESDSTFYMYYYDELDERQIYLPPIAAVDQNFDYTSLYATDDMGLGTGIPRVLYLPVAAGNISFNERIAIEEQTREQSLARYGLDDSKNVVTLMYVDPEGKTVQHTLRIGDVTPGNHGYYLLVDDRPYVYATSTNTLSYLLQPFSYFVKPSLVAPGTVGGQYSQFEGYLALSFEEFVNRVYTKDDGALPIPSDATVLVKATERLAGEDTVGPERTYEFSLPKLAEDETYRRLYSYLVGRSLGESSLRYTQKLEGAAARRILFETKDSLAYEYTILRVDALLREDSELTDGTVGTDTQLKITYTCKKEGDTEATELQGILDLTEAALSADTVARIAALPVGQALSTSEQVSFTYVYTKDNAASRSYDMIVDDILAIYEDGMPVNKITERSVVYCRYHYTYGKEESASMLGTLDLGAAQGDYKAGLLTALVGEGVKEGLNVKVYTYVEQYEIIADYAEYDMSEMSSYVTEEQIVAFGFQNQADRDPFYRDTYFTNRLPSDHKHALYGLNDISCLAIVSALGGQSSNTTSTSGFFGTETVAIGLSASVMEEYHLYDNRLYIEFPRGVTGVTDDEEVTEFRWLYTLGFTMYVSDVMYDADTGAAYRYVGSDMYDVVVRVDADALSFLDYSFAEYWARETMFLVDMDTIDSLKMEAFLDDFKGSYEFSFDRITIKDHLWTRMDVIPEGVLYEPFEEMMEALGKTEGQPIGLNQIYDQAWGVTDAVYGKEYAGDGYFKDYLQNLFFISYSGSLSEAEQEHFLQSEGPVFRMTVDMNVKSNLYVYEFYRGSDRRVMVRLYCTTEAGEPIEGAVQEFYISSFGFKKLVTGVQELLSGRPVSGDNEYGG